MKNTFRNILNAAVIPGEGILRKKKRKKDVLFVVANELMFSYVRPVFERLREDRRLRLWFNFGARKQSRQGNLAGIKREYRLRSVPYCIAKNLPWDLIVFPQHGPYFRKTVNKIYIGHGLNSGKLTEGEDYKYGRYSRDENGRVIYRKIFVAGEHEREKVRSGAQDHFPLVRVVGSLMVDEMLAEKPDRDACLKGLDLDPNRKTVMLTSTWGPDSLAQNVCERFLRNAGSVLERYNLIFTIHPNNFLAKHSPTNDWQALLDATTHKNMYTVRNFEPAMRYLPLADILITDHTSTGMYYLFFQRPIIFYDNRNVRYGEGAFIPEIRDRAYVVNGLGNIREDIDRAFARFDPREMGDLSKRVCGHVGRAWERYAEEIYDLLQIEVPA